MRVNTTYKKLCKISDDLKIKTKKMYKCLWFIDFTDDTHFNIIYKVFKKDKIIKEYVLLDDDKKNTSETIKKQIKKDYGTDINIDMAELDYLTIPQLRYLADTEEVNN